MHCVARTVGIFFSDLGDEKGAHAGASTAAERVSELKALQAVARLGFFADNVQHGVDQLGTFGVVAFGPVVSCTRLTCKITMMRMMTIIMVAAVVVTYQRRSCLVERAGRRDRCEQSPWCLARDRRAQREEHICRLDGKRG